MAGGALWIAALASLVALAALLLSSQPASAQTSIKLISTSGQTTHGQTALGKVGTDTEVDQSFTTGSHASGYKLTSVKLDLWVGSGTLPTFSVSIRSNFRFDSKNYPSTTLGTLTAPASLTTGLNTFTASGDGIDLAAGTIYWVDLDITVEATALVLAIRRTQSDAEDAGGATGWSIADVFWYADFDRNLKREDGRTLKLEIHGYAKSPASPPSPANDPDNVYEVLQLFYDGDITEEQLHARLQELARTGDVQGPTPVPLANTPDTFVQVGQTSGGCGSDSRPPFLSLEQIKDRQEWMCDTSTNQWVLIQRPPIDPTPYNIIEKLAAHDNPGNVCSHTLTYTVPATPPSWWTSATSWDTNIGGKTYTVRNLNFDAEACRAQRRAQYNDPSS